MSDKPQPTADHVIRNIQKNERGVEVVSLEFAAGHWWMRLGLPEDGAQPAVGADFVTTYAQALANWEARASRCPQCGHPLRNHMKAANDGLVCAVMGCSCQTE